MSGVASLANDTIDGEVIEAPDVPPLIEADGLAPKEMG
jgi:hypothetical protein